MSINWDVIMQEYIGLEGNIKLKDLAKKHGVKPATLRSRKIRDNWDDAIKGNVATKTKKVATRSKAQEKIMQTMKEVPEELNLKERQRMFCLYYVKYWNATKAYQKAYGCSYNAAMVEGCKILRRPNVAAEIERLKEGIREGISLEIMAVIQKQIDIAFADMKDYAEWGNIEIPERDYDGREMKDENGDLITRPVNFVKVKDSTEVDGTIVTEVTQGKDGVKVKLASRDKAFERLEKYFDIMPDKWKRDIESKKLELEKHKVELFKTKNNLNDNDDKEQTGVVMLPEANEGDM